MEKIFDTIINEICKERGIKVQRISYDWIKILEKEGKTSILVAYNFELNSAVSKVIANDKYATYALLEANDIPIIEHKLIFNPQTRQEYYYDTYIDYIKELLDKDKKIIIKVNDSSQGKEVFCLNSIEDVENKINTLFEYNDNLSICPFVEIDYEYRAIYLDGEIIYIYKKEKPSVIGDGKSSLKDLIQAKSETEEIDIDIMDSLDLNSIPQNGEKVTISWKHNLSNSAEPILIDKNEENYNEIIELAIKTGKTLGITFASIDICLTSKKEILVMEVNSNVCMSKFSKKIPNGYQIVKDVYSKAIDKLKFR